MGHPESAEDPHLFNVDLTSCNTASGSWPIPQRQSPLHPPEREGSIAGAARRMDCATAASLPCSFAYLILGTVAAVSDSEHGREPKRDAQTWENRCKSPRLGRLPPAPASKNIFPGSAVLAPACGVGGGHRQSHRGRGATPSRQRAPRAQQHSAAFPRLRFQVFYPRDPDSQLWVQLALSQDPGGPGVL